VFASKLIHIKIVEITLSLIAVPLPPNKIPFADKINNNNNKN
jgi:hypothetical protein